MLNQRASVVSEESASEAIKTMLLTLDECYEWVDEIPMTKMPGRFGNPAFRDWHAKLCQNVSKLVSCVIKAVPDVHGSLKEEEMTAHVAELSAYWTRSFGDPTRIDYGSGHEAMFVVLMYSLHTLNVLTDEDVPALVLLVFKRYLHVTRRLQLRYMLEPAGSRGVWGLDDYSFLPFLWGSSQLVSSTRISPNVIADDDALSEHRHEFLYLDAIAFIKEMKTGPFFEHSPMLHDISGAQGGWAKINSGMIKMYRAEVWGKRVVIQHFVFGNLFQFDDAPPPVAPSNDGDEG